MSGLRRTPAERQALPYGPDGEDNLAAAQDYIGRLINRPNAPGWCWDALLTPDRIEQTCAALVRVKQNVQRQYTQRRATATDALAAKAAGRITAAELYRVQAEVAEWRARIAHFEDAVDNRLTQAQEIRRQVRVAVTLAENATQDREIRNLLAKLVQAVATHRATVDAEYEPTTADRLLWSRLDLLRLPSGHPIIELIKRQEIDARPQPEESTDGHA